MIEHKNATIIALAGLPGSHVDTVIQNLTEKNIPKVSRQDIVSQIHHLIEAGQRRIVTDELDSLDLYKTMKHEFAGELTIIGVVTDRSVRHNRLIHQDKAIEDDWNQDQTDIATVIGVADYFVVDNDGEEALLRNVYTLLEKIGFYS